MCPPIIMNSNILYSTSNVRGALCLAKHNYCIKSSQLWQGEAVIWCNLSLFCSIKFLPLFGKKKIMFVRIMVGSIMNVRKLSTMQHGPNNFLNKKWKKKNYTRYIFLEEGKKKKNKTKKNKTKTKPIFPSSNMETKNETLSKGISFRSNTGFFGIWTLVK